MGRIFIQPAFAFSEDIEASSLVIYPHRIEDSAIPASVEWAAGSQTPIFCHEEDIETLVSQGFGAYRFHGLSGYKEIGFQGGSVEFYPARRRRAAGLKGSMVEFGELFGLLRVPAYHVLLRSRGEQPVLFLGSSQIDGVEWQVLTRSLPSLVVGSAEVPDAEWEALAQKFGTKIVKAREISEVVPDAATPATGRKESEREWPEKISALS